MQDPSPAMLDDKQTVQLLKRDCRNGEEIECNDRLAMISKEREPTLAGISSAVHTPEITRNASFGDLKTELQHFAMDLRRSPTGILVCQAADQITKLARDFRSANPGTRCPSPVQSETGAVPANHGIGLHDQEHAFPARPEAPECDPEQPIETIQGRPWPFSFEDCELLSQSDHLQRGVGPRAKEDSDSAQESNNQIEHEPSFYHFAAVRRSSAGHIAS